MHSQWLDLRLRSLRLPEWFTAQQASSTNSSSRTASVIIHSNLCSFAATYLLWFSHHAPFHLPRGLDALSGKNKSANPPSLPMDAVVLSLQDLIFYFRPPEEELEHEDKQFKLRSLKNRQNLFQEEVGLPTENWLLMIMYMDWTHVWM